MKATLLILGMLSSIVLYGQNRVSDRDIEKKKYREVVSSYGILPDSTKPDKYAMYPDGLIGLHKLVNKYLTYPVYAYSNGIQGVVYVKFIVEKDGTVTNVEVVKSVDSELDEEAIRVMKKMDIWVPAYKNKLTVRIAYKFPVTFKL